MENILIVEDDKNMNEAISEYMSVLGHNILTAFDGKKG